MRYKVIGMSFELIISLMGIALVYLQNDRGIAAPFGKFLLKSWIRSHEVKLSMACEAVTGCSCWANIIIKSFEISQSECSKKREALPYGQNWYIFIFKRCIVANTAFWGFLMFMLRVFLEAWKHTVVLVLFLFWFRFGFELYWFEFWLWFYENSIDFFWFYEEFRFSDIKVPT